MMEDVQCLRPISAYICGPFLLGLLLAKLVSTPFVKYLCTPGHYSSFQPRELGSFVKSTINICSFFELGLLLTFFSSVPESGYSGAASYLLTFEPGRNLKIYFSASRPVQPT